MSISELLLTTKERHWLYAAKNNLDRYFHRFSNSVKSSSTAQQPTQGSVSEKSKKESEEV